MRRLVCRVAENGQVPVENGLMDGGSKVADKERAPSSNVGPTECEERLHFLFFAKTVQATTSSTSDLLENFRTPKYTALGHVSNDLIHACR